MTTLNWLHLTDLHLGQGESKTLLDRLKDKFFEDLEGLRKLTGPLDLILFTGDLANRGSAAEFQKVDQFLDELSKKLGQPAPVFLAIPGNHDLVRPEVAFRSAMVSLAVEQGAFWDDEIVQTTVQKSFENYETWWRRKRTDQGLNSLRAGALPGDFSFTFDKYGYRFGLIGLNTTFLQLSGGDFEKKLAIDSRQFEGLCPSGLPEWRDNHDFRLLLTHQPPSWFGKAALDVFRDEVRPYFDLHLCGHLHESRYKGEAEGGGRTHRVHQGCSLFGLVEFEAGGQPKGRLHGYSVGGIEIDEDRVSLMFWPRKAFKAPSGEWHFDRHVGDDGGWELEPEGHTRRESWEIPPRVRAVAVSPGFDPAVRSLTVAVDWDGKIQLDNTLTDRKVELDPLAIDTVELLQKCLIRGAIKEETELQVLGKILFHSLFHGSILAAFKERLSKARRGREAPLKVHLLLDAANDRLANLPWEYMFHDPSDDRERRFFLATETDLNLSRRCKPPGGAQTIFELESEKLTVLILQAEPGPPERRIAGGGLDQEMERVPNLKPRAVNPSDNFAEVLRNDQSHVVHFVGYRRYNRDYTEHQISWCEQPGSHRGPWIDDATFVQRFGEMKRRPKLVFLYVWDLDDVQTQSFMTLAPRIIREGIPMVVGMQHQITSRGLDDEQMIRAYRHLSIRAVRFCSEFYQKLADGESVDEAVQMGRNKLRGSPEFGSAILYMCCDGMALVRKPGQDERTSTGVSGLGLSGSGVSKPPSQEAARGRA